MTTEEKTVEWCAECDTEVELKAVMEVQKCPSCGKRILPCSICPGPCVNVCELEKKRDEMEKDNGNQ